MDNIYIFKQRIVQAEPMKLVDYLKSIGEMTIDRPDLDGFRVMHHSGLVDWHAKTAWGLLARKVSPAEELIMRFPIQVVDGYPHAKKYENEFANVKEEVSHGTDVEQTLKHHRTDVRSG